MTKFAAGDHVFTWERGVGVVYEVQLSGLYTYPVCVLFKTYPAMMETYTIEGYLLNEHHAKRHPETLLHKLEKEDD